MDRLQLIALGLSRKAIRKRCAAGRLFEIYRGVYAVGHPLLTAKGRYRAAVLACGDRAVSSHRCAAYLLGLQLWVPTRIEVTVPRGRRKRPPGIEVHESRSLPPEEVTTVDGIPCTSWARTIVNVAAAAREREVDRMIERSMILRVFDLREIQAALATAGGRAGTGTVRRLLARFGDEPPPTRTELERRFLDLVRAAGLPEPVVNATVEGHEVDFHWPAAKLIVETDGRATHDTAYGFESDRGRDLDLELADWRVIRITWRQITEEPHRVIAVLRARLSRAAPAAAGRRR